GIAFDFTESKVKAGLHSARLMREVDANVTAHTRRNTWTVEGKKFSGPQGARLRSFLCEDLTGSFQAGDLPSGVPTRLAGSCRGEIGGQVSDGEGRGCAIGLCTRKWLAVTGSIEAVTERSNDRSAR